MSELVESEAGEFDLDLFHQNLYPHYRSLLNKFKKTSKFFVFFNLSFIFVFLSGLLSLVYLSAVFSKSTVIAFTLGGLFLTTFSYFVLLFYFQTKKCEEHSQLVNSFLEATREAISVPNNLSELHLSIAHATIKLSTYLHDFERGFYRSPFKFKSLNSLFESIGFFCHFEDVCKMKQLLLKSAIDEHHKQVRISPTDIELHTSLADTYILLSKVHFNIRSHLENSPLRFRFKKLLFKAGDRFKSTVKQAIEEFTIISHYSPDDPWVHMQLAQSYRDLKMFKEEIGEYETILELSPSDSKILFRLGVLYFEQGQDAKGLKIYELLKNTNYQKAEKLIRFYGVYSEDTALLL